MPTPSAYARALTEVLKTADSKNLPKVTEALTETVRKNGDWRQRRRIFQVCEMSLREKTNRPLVKIEVARPIRPELRKELHRKLGGTKNDYQEIIRPELVAGTKITINDDIQLDLSIQKITNAIFEKITATE